MSTSEFSSSMESQDDKDDTIDIEHFILQIQERPPLWDKHSKLYSDRDLKLRLWDEVCQNNVSNWDDLSKERKKKKGADIQKKWKNLKDCFSRELAAQKSCVSGQAVKKRRKYIFFDQLSFLIPINTPRDTSGNVQPMEEECIKSDIQPDEENTPPKQSCLDSRHSRHLRKIGAKSQAHRENIDLDEEILHILREKKDRNFDEDVSFAEMLIPMLRKLNDNQKLYAKMEILSAVDRAKRHVPHSSVVTKTVPIYPKPSVIVKNVTKPINPQLFPNTRATYLHSLPGTSSGSYFVNPRNIIIQGNKTISKQPQIQENCNDFLQQFAKDLQSPVSGGSPDSEEYYDMSTVSLNK